MCGGYLSVIIGHVELWLEMWSKLGNIQRFIEMIETIQNMDNSWWSVIIQWRCSTAEQHEYTNDFTWPGKRDIRNMARQNKVCFQI